MQYIDGVYWTEVSCKQSDFDIILNVSQIDCNGTDWVFITNLLNRLHSECKKREYHISATLVYKIRRIMWLDGKLNLETENTMRLALNKTSQDYKYLDFCCPTKKSCEDVLLEKYSELLNCLENNLLSKSINSGIYDVIFSPKAAGFFVHEILGHPLEADIVNENNSVYKLSDIGRLILPSSINIEERPDGVKKIGLNFGKYDDNGKPLKEKRIVDKGQLKNFIDYNRSDDIRNKAMPRMHNLCLLPGEENSYMNMRREMEYGLAIEDVISGKLDIINGICTLLCGCCLLIRDGIPIGTIDNVMICDKIENITSAIVAIGNDSEVVIGKCNKKGQTLSVGMEAPSIKMKDVNVLIGGR